KSQIVQTGGQLNVDQIEACRVATSSEITTYAGQDRQRRCSEAAYFSFIACVRRRPAGPDDLKRESKIRSGQETPQERGGDHRGSVHVFERALFSREDRLCQGV